MIPLPSAWKSWLRLRYAQWLRLAPGSRIEIKGPGHVVEWHDAHLHRCRVRLLGENNRLSIGAGAMLWGATIQLTGRNLTCHIGAHTRLRGGTLVVTDEFSRLEIGERTTMTDPMLVAQGGRSVTLGRDCMIAYGADIRCSDGHSVLDAPSGRDLNPAMDVRIGDHVWIGIHGQVLKGVTIGAHAIVAARSVVTRAVPAATLVAGNPARAIRGNITWDRQRPAAAPLVATVRAGAAVS